MPDWLHDIIRGDAYAVLGVTLDAGERERLNRVKARKPKIKMRLNMTQKEQVLNALKGGAMTIDGLSAATGIGTGSLYAVCSSLDNAGEIVRESVDGGRTRQYRIASQAPEAQADPEAETPALPPAKVERAHREPRKRAVKAIAKPGEVQLYRPGEKFAVNLARGKAYILFTDASSFVNLLTGEEVHPTRAEMQNAVPLSNLSAEIRHTVSLG